MATISGIRGWAFPQVRAEEETPRGVTVTRQNPNRLRAMPNEDLYLFRKRIDNSRVVPSDSKRVQLQIIQKYE